MIASMANKHESDWEFCNCPVCVVDRVLQEWEPEDDEHTGEMLNVLTAGLAATFMYVPSTERAALVSQLLSGVYNNVSFMSRDQPAAGDLVH